jgi:hypothetical protein
MLYPRAIAVVAVLSAATMALARVTLEPEASHAGRLRNPAWLPSGRSARLASFGHRLLVADFFWLKLVQYVGETVMAKEDRWQALYPLADLVTDLDPRHGYAYQVAGSNLAGLAHRYGEADRILTKGIENLPDRWQLYWMQSVNKFLFEGDYAEGAAYARKAAEVGKKPHLALLASNLSLVADTDDEYRAATAVLQESLKLADQPEMREQLERRLIKVQTYLALSQIERAMEAFRKVHGRLPSWLGELPGAFSGQVPLDPSGGRFVYDPITGQVRSSVLGKREPLRVGEAPRPRTP